MSWEPARPGLTAQPAARRSIPVTQCSHAAGVRYKSAHLMPAGLSPFAPFAASAVSNAAVDSSSEEYLEDSWCQTEAVATIFSAGLLLPVCMYEVWPCVAPAIGLVLTKIWPHLAVVWTWIQLCNCNKREKLLNCTKSQLHALRVSFMLWLRDKASAMLMNEVAQVIKKNPKKLFSPEQLVQLQRVLGEHFDADKACGTDKPLSEKIRLLVQKMEGHLSPEQLDLLQQGINELYGTDMT